MLRVPAWKSVSIPHEYDLMSSSVGSWMSCCHRGDALELGRATGYGRMRQPCSLASVDGWLGGVGLRGVTSGEAGVAGGDVGGG